MNPILVCPFDHKLIASLRGRDLVIWTQDISDLPHIAAVATQNHLHCAWFQSDVALSSLDLPPDIDAIPAALQLGELGPLHQALPQVRRLKGCPIRVFFPSQRAESYIEARVLASLGVHAGVWMVRGKVDWDRLDDLLHYAVYSRLDHASIEPFENTLWQYEPGKRCNPAAIAFEDPYRYLHVAADGKIALSRADLLAGRFLGAVDALEKLIDSPNYLKQTCPYGEAFLRFDGCSTCESWNLCGGRFASDAPNSACKIFFANLMEAGDMSLRNQAVEVRMWRA